MLKDDGLGSRMTIGALLLAAGAGSRLGGRPKSLLELDGVPLIVRQLAALSDAGVDEVVVVLGHHARAIEAAIRHRPATRVHNPTPDEGPAASVRIGLQALSLRLDAVMVALADQPLITAQDITALISAYRQRGGKAMVVPRVRATDGSTAPGNPVMFDAALRAQWLAGGTELTGRQWRENNPERVHWFETDNRHYGVDIDTPGDLRQFAISTGHVLRWPPAFANTSDDLA